MLSVHLQNVAVSATKGLALLDFWFGDFGSCKGERSFRTHTLLTRGSIVKECIFAHFLLALSGFFTSSNKIYSDTVISLYIFQESQPVGKRPNNPEDLVEEGDLLLTLNIYCPVIFEKVSVKFSRLGFDTFIQLEECHAPPVALLKSLKQCDAIKNELLNTTIVLASTVIQLEPCYVGHRVRIVDDKWPGQLLMILGCS